VGAALEAEWDQLLKQSLDQDDTAGERSRDPFQALKHGEAVAEASARKTAAYSKGGRDASIVLFCWTSSSASGTELPERGPGVGGECPSRVRVILVLSTSNCQMDYIGVPVASADPAERLLPPP
jgi:hypothetical protein